MDNKTLWNCGGLYRGVCCHSDVLSLWIFVSFSSTDSFCTSCTSQHHLNLYKCVHVCLIPSLLSTLWKCVFLCAHKRLLNMCVRMRPVHLLVFCMCISAFLHHAISQPPTETDTYTVRRDETFSSLSFQLISLSSFLTIFNMLMMCDPFSPLCCLSLKAVSLNSITLYTRKIKLIYTVTAVYCIWKV